MATDVVIFLVFAAAQSNVIKHPFVKLSPRSFIEKSLPKLAAETTMPQQPSKTRKITGQDQMYRGILPQSDSDWGEFLYTFDLGLSTLYLCIFVC